LRHEKNCLNCGAEVNGRYCGQCGQENIEPKETFGSLVHHFVGDITHYDTKFFITLKYLLFKPGYLTKEYTAGRRNKYLDPIRTYVFVSLLFFVALFFKKNDEETASAENYNGHYVNKARQQLADSLRNSDKPALKSTAYDSIKSAVVKNIADNLDTLAVKDTTEAIGLSVGNNGVIFTLVENKYSTVAEYDSAQQAMPDSLRDKGFFRWMLRTNISLKSRYGSRSQVVVGENFEHNVPKMMFVLLPLFAWFIYIFHNRKKYYYAQHAIFSIHFHSFMFVLFLLFTVIGWLFPHINNLIVLPISALVILFIYMAAALKQTYNQSFFIASLKTLAIGVMYIISLLICIIALAFINFFTA